MYNKGSNYTSAAERDTLKDFKLRLSIMDLGLGLSSSTRCLRGTPRLLLRGDGVGISVDGEGSLLPLFK